MDLLTTVRKEGSRGGRGDFKWSDVQSSSHRENYLGHSLMAPVGRWQRGRDLNWYAKGDADEEGGETAAEKAECERKEEIKHIKEVEQDALARALGYHVPPRNPNMESLGDRKEVDKILKEAAEEEDDVEVGKGVGYGKFGTNQGDLDERILGSHDGAREAGLDLDRAVKQKTDRSRHKRHRSWSRSRDRDRHRRRQHKGEDGEESRRRSRSRSRERMRTRRSRSRDRPHREHRRNRSRSPYHNDRKDRANRKENNYERRR